MSWFWNDFERTFALMDAMRRRQLDDARRVGVARWPEVRLDDAGDRLVLTADLPGVAPTDLGVTLEGDVLKISGGRNAAAPEGYSTHRQERSSYRFDRSYQLPVRVDPEKVRADLNNGVLKVTLEKSADARPREITITTA